MGGDVISEIALKLVLPQLLRNCQKLIVLFWLFSITFKKHQSAHVS